MATVTSSLGESRVVLNNVSWETFDSLAQEARGGRMAYDRGSLEIMSPSHHHENVKRLIGRMIEAFSEELEISMKSAGSTTLKRKDLEQGIENDESYYLSSYRQVLSNKEIELPADPPPDLSVEVDISRSSINKLEICRSIGIKEVWRFHDEQIEIHVLQDDGHYRLQSSSRELPDFPLAFALELLSQRQSLDDTRIIRQFRAFVRDSSSSN